MGDKVVVLSLLAAFFGTTAAVCEGESCAEAKGAAVVGESFIQRSRTQDQTWRLEDASDADQMNTQLQQLTKVAQIGQTSAVDRLSALEEARHVVTSFSRNATAHLNKTQQDMMNQVITVLEATMYASMDIDHENDIKRLTTAAGSITTANAAHSARFAANGDLGILRASAEGLVTNKKACQTAVSNFQQAATKASSDLSTHINGIADPPAAAPFPTPKTATNLHSFFSSSSYCNWFSSQSTSFGTVYDSNTSAYAALATKTGECAVIQASLDTEYCDWKLVLDQACSDWSTKYADLFKAANDTKNEVAIAAGHRHDAYVAGQTIITHVQYILGKSAFRKEVTLPNATRYKITPPTFESAAACDQTVLDHADYSGITCGGGGGGGGAPNGAVPNSFRYLKLIFIKVGHYATTTRPGTVCLSGFRVNTSSGGVLYPKKSTYHDFGAGTYGESILHASFSKDTGKGGGWIGKTPNEAGANIVMDFEQEVSLFTYGWKNCGGSTCGNNLQKYGLETSSDGISWAPLPSPQDVNCNWAHGNDNRVDWFDFPFSYAFQRSMEKGAFALGEMPANMRGNDMCPPGTFDITNAALCEQAATAWKLPYGEAKHDAWRPEGCFREKIDPARDPRGSFNFNSLSHRRRSPSAESRRSVCVRP